MTYGDWIREGEDVLRAMEEPTPEEDMALSLELARENAEEEEPDRPGAVLTRVCDGVRAYGHATGLTTQERTRLVGIVLKAIEGFYMERLIQRSRADQRKHTSSSAIHCTTRRNQMGIEQWFSEQIENSHAEDLDEGHLAEWARRARRLEADNTRLRSALAFARSVILSGEPWTETCEQVIQGALTVDEAL